MSVRNNYLVDLTQDKNVSNSWADFATVFLYGFVSGAVIVSAVGMSAKKVYVNGNSKCRIHVDTDFGEGTSTTSDEPKGKTKCRPTLTH